jgi:hypothetical protein
LFTDKESKMPQCQSENGWWEVEAFTRVRHKPVTKRVWAATEKGAIDEFEETFGYRYARPFTAKRDPIQTVAPRPQPLRKQPKRVSLPLLDLLSSAPA